MSFATVRAGRVYKLFSVMALLALTPAAHAVLIAPVSATASDFYSNGADSRSPDHTIDGSGLTGNQHTNLVAPAAGDTMWLSSANPTPTITFDLGSTLTIDGLHVWNYNELADGATDLTYRGVKTTNILISTDNVTYAPLTDPVSSTTTFTFLRANAQSTYTGADYALPTTSARYVRFTVLAAFLNDGYTGLSEVRVDQFVPAPEPATAGVLGAGALLLVARRSRRTR